MRAVLVVCWCALSAAELTGHGGFAVLLGITASAYLVGLSVAGRALL